MGKFIGSVLSTAAIIGADILGGPIVALGVAVAGSILTKVLTPTQKPDAVQTAIKSPTAARIAAYGRARLFASWECVE